MKDAARYAKHSIRDQSEKACKWMLINMAISVCWQSAEVCVPVAVCMYKASPIPSLHDNHTSNAKPAHTSASPSCVTIPQGHTHATHLSLSKTATWPNLYRKLKNYFAVCQLICFFPVSILCIGAVHARCSKVKLECNMIKAVLQYVCCVGI